MVREQPRCTGRLVLAPVRDTVGGGGGTTERSVNDGEAKTNLTSSHWLFLLIREKHMVSAAGLLGRTN